MAANKDERITNEMVDQLLAGRDPATVFSSGGLVDELKKRLAERMLNAELDHHLDSAAEAESGNHRNGYGSKTVITDTGKLELAIPRDRQGRFDPALIGKYRRRLAGFDEKIIALYARGMTTREIAEHIGELYGTEISPDLVSAVTDSVLEEVAAWQNRGLEATYAVVFFDALRVKIRNEGLVSNRAVYLAIGLRCSGRKEILGLWLEQTEGAKFWLRVMSELRNHGVQDILIAVVDGLKDFPRPLPRCFPRRWCRPASSICCVIRCSSLRGRNTGRWRRHSGRSIRPSRPRWRASGWRILTAARGAKNTRPSRTAGGATGSR